MISAKLTAFKWAWVLDCCPGYHWQLRATQQFPIPLAMKQGSPLAAALSSHHSPIVQIGMQGQFTSWDLLQKRQLCNPLRCRCGKLVEAFLLKELSTCSVLGQNNGLTIELLTEKKRNGGSSVICLLVFVYVTEKNKQFSVRPEIWSCLFYYFSMT